MLLLLSVVLAQANSWFKNAMWFQPRLHILLDYNRYIEMALGGGVMSRL